MEFNLNGEELSFYHGYSKWIFKDLHDV